MPSKDNPGKEIADLIFKHFKPTSAQEVQDAIKTVFAPVFESILNAEMTGHLGYEKSSSEDKSTSNRRNGYSTKTIKTSIGEGKIKVPRDRDGSFDPMVVGKHQRDVSGIENKVLALYARGMSQRDIAATIEDIYGFTVSQDKVSRITDLILEDVEKWQNRPLVPVYAFTFVDCIYTNIRDERGRSRNQAVYVVPGINMQGHKDVLGLWVAPTESKSSWMNIFDTLKQRGVEDILFLSMDGVSGLEDGVKSIFPKTVVQRCIVHLIRNSLKYVPGKDYKKFCADIKTVYQAVSLEECRRCFEQFKAEWENNCPGAVKVWERNFTHVEQLFDYPSEIRRVMYTTNAIESVNSSLRKVTRHGSFENENAVRKVFYLRIKELDKKWTSPIRNWAKVLNQITMFDDFVERLTQYHVI